MTPTLVYAVSGPLLMGLFGIGVGLWTLSKIRRRHRTRFAPEHLPKAAAGKDAAE